MPRPNRITDLFEILSSISPATIEWIRPSTSFKNLLEINAEQVEIRVTQEDESFICVIPFYSAKNIPPDVLTCIQKKLSEWNITDFGRVFYHGIVNDLIWIRYNIDVTDDKEENTRKYIKARGSIQSYLATKFHDELWQLIETCKKSPF
jgi:hypothetical protein